MRPVPQGFLLVLLCCLVGLCWRQWWRETALRKAVQELRAEVDRLSGVEQELEARAKAADTEILRLTADLGELRTHSVSKASLEEQKAANQQLVEFNEKEKALIISQNEAIAKQNAAIQKDNENIATLSSERDKVARRLSEVTALYNKLVEAARQPPSD